MTDDFEIVNGGAVRDLLPASSGDGKADPHRPSSGERMAPNVFKLLIELRDHDHTGASVGTLSAALKFNPTYVRAALGQLADRGLVQPPAKQRARWHAIEFAPEQRAKRKRGPAENVASIMAALRHHVNQGASVSALAGQLQLESNTVEELLEQLAVRGLARRPAPNRKMWWAEEAGPPELQPGWPKQKPCLKCGEAREATWAGDRIHSRCTSGSLSHLEADAETPWRPA